MCSSNSCRNNLMLLWTSTAAPVTNVQYPVPLTNPQSCSRLSKSFCVPSPCSIFVINVVRLIVPIRQGGHCPQLSTLKKFENFRVWATIQVASSTTMTPADPSPVPAFLSESKSIGRSSWSGVIIEKAGPPGNTALIFRPPGTTPVNEITNRHTHRHFVNSRPIHCPAQGEHHRPGTPLSPYLRKPCSTFMEDRRDIAKCLYIIHERRLAIEPKVRRVKWR